MEWVVLRKEASVQIQFFVVVFRYRLIIIACCPGFARSVGFVTFS